MRYRRGVESAGWGFSGVNLALWLGAFALVVLVFWAVTHNRFVRLQNLLRESWANVDVVLKRRYDLIPNLVETVKGYAAHEKDVFEHVARARELAVADVGPVAHQAQTEGELVRSVNQLLARVEAYPELKASAHFTDLQRELVNTEDRIAAARRFYNANVRDFNLLLESFTTSMIGSGMGLKPQEFFEIEELHLRAAPSVSARPSS